MSLLFVDGCQGGDITQKWDSTSTGTRSTASPRFAGGAYLTSSVAYKTIPASSELFTAAAFWFPTGAHTLFSVYSDSGATQQITITRNSSLKLEVRLGSSSGTVLATGTTNVATSAWVHVEAHYVIDDSTGVVQIRLNGSASNEISFTGDTRNGGTSTSLDKVAVVSTNSSTKLTDITINNASGSLNNTWLGNNTITTLVPNGQGFYNQGDADPSTPTALRYTLVDELPYSSSDGIFEYYNKRDTWMFTDLPYGTNLVRGLQVNQQVYGSGGGATPMRRLIRVGTTDYYGTAYTPVFNVQDVYSEVLETDPSTSSAWTTLAVDTLEAGIGGTFVTSGFDSYLSGMSVEAVIEAVVSTNNVKVFGGGTITVDTPNNVKVNGGGTIVVRAAGQLGGAIVVAGGGTIVVTTQATDYPNPAPADPTLGTPGPNEPVIDFDAEDYPDPVLVDGVPVDWEPT